MLRSHFRPLAVVSLLLLGLGLLGTSCQQTADDCRETLTCESSGGTDTMDGTAGLGANGPGGNGGNLGGRVGVGCCFFFCAFFLAAFSLATSAGSRPLEYIA